MLYGRDGDDFDYEEWGLTRAQYNRLRKAVDDGIVPYGIAFSRRNLNQYKYEPSFSDQLIRSWSGNSYKDPYADRERDINQNDFERIVQEAARRTSRVNSVEIVDTNVYTEFSSRSGKETWVASYDFNDNGRITGKYRCWPGYSNANAPRFFVENIVMLIKRLIDEKEF